MPKLHYFDLYGRAEAARQAFTIAGVAFEDNRIGGEDWATLKASGKCEFGSMPMLELDDGTCLSQSMPIMRYVCKVYGGDKMIHSGDALAEWNADSLVAYWSEDFVGKKGPLIFKYVFNPAADAVERDAEFTKVNEEMPAVFAKMEAKFAKVDTKFLLGDKPSHFDICLGVSMCSMYQENGDDDKLKVWKTGYRTLIENGSYPKMNAFSQNYRALIADYLAARPKCTI